VEGLDRLRTTAVAIAPGRLPPPPPPGPIGRVPIATRPSAVPDKPWVPALGGIPRRTCPLFYLSGQRGRLPAQAPHLVRMFMRQSSTIARCEARGGVHLEEGYAADVCVSPYFNQCVFYEEAEL
jgi:hypothetical protein